MGKISLYDCSPLSFGICNPEGVNIRIFYPLNTNASILNSYYTLENNVYICDINLKIHKNEKYFYYITTHRDDGDDCI